MGSQQHLRSRISRCGPSTWAVRALKHHQRLFFYVPARISSINKRVSYISAARTERCKKAWWIYLLFKSFLSMLKFATWTEQIVAFHFAILNGPDLPLGWGWHGCKDQSITHSLHGIAGIFWDELCPLGILTLTNPWICNPLYFVFLVRYCLLQ